MKAVMKTLLLMALMTGICCSYGQQARTAQQTAGDYVAVEEAYKRVVKYYNPSLTDAQALKITRLLLYYSDKFKLDPRLVVSVVVVESRFKPNAVSPKGAMGLGQLMPGTASMLGVKNPFDVGQNLYGTSRYLRMQHDKWSHKEDVLDLMLASYNAGPNAVAKYGGVPPYNETKAYVKKVKKLYHFFVYGT